MGDEHYCGIAHNHSMHELKRFILRYNRVFYYVLKQKITGGGGA